MIGNDMHYMSVPPSRDPQSVRRFGCTTAELKAMAGWLKRCKIRTVANGIEVMTAMTIFSEVGWDMSKWKTENHFVSWLKLSVGGKIIGKDRMPTNNRATTALRMSARSLRLSNSYLGAQFRRLQSRLGAPVATKAMPA